MLFVDNWFIDFHGVGNAIHDRLFKVFASLDNIISGLYELHITTGFVFWLRAYNSRRTPDC
ncbi:MAG TPA: hypothetical protein DCR43_08305 [Bacteroidales bacterium]|nr:MAG: hypothetical protein A2X11_15425 [Bacteroidetes bacterium GWE2_42_24]OFY31728.1 MAG: hypothetical protein A2X09_09170 [Bacteroidetes bacterium GWF2_43_11]HAQ65836.1 hypothetical protein [Bacteroidales bacterium]HBZ67001.1 hypothetical protein [Bacteroidales bacterium]